MEIEIYVPLVDLGGDMASIRLIVVVYVLLGTTAPHILSPNHRSGYFFPLLICPIGSSMDSLATGTAINCLCL